MKRGEMVEASDEENFAGEGACPEDKLETCKNLTVC
jgi:hypothetical protein